ncbi:hypothetical protein ALC57_09333 [Trachymyrmex cornetzi]|uniref:Reverse transcriptase domain-containing protein n=1 Tax=Trachymyrmex cornetzi TaxID=471704 RepID=A0A151J5G5_9HYME|nr:hypothetical protein ALC57_09333 [Trachymyrmex cornetzi]
MLLGFCEDYKRVVVNARHELILIRPRNDYNCLVGNPATEPEIELFKVQWRMPHVALNEINKLSMLRALESGRYLSISFRSWDLYEYPLLQNTTKHSWAVKTATQLEKPRYVIFALQTGRKNVMSQDVSVFDDCNLSNVKVYLNSDFYPYGDLNLDFGKKGYAVLFDMYARFRKAYYGIDSFEYKILSYSGGILPRAYSLPKIHKLNCPFRLIISSIDSLLYVLATFIHDVISKNVPKSVYNIDNSFQLVKRLKGTRFEIEHVLISMDVVSLFTNILTDLAIESIDKRWNFVRDKVNISKDEFILGVQALEALGFQPLFYFRYVNDIVMAVPKNLVNFTLETFNSLHDRLKFALEFDDDKINFLDITIINNNNLIEFNWYHKPTYLGRYLKFLLIHPLSQKRGIIIYKTDRAFLLSDPKYHQQNFERIVSTLLKNDYPIDLIFNTINARLKILIKVRYNRKNQVRKSRGTVLLGLYYLIFQKFQMNSKELVKPLILN